MNDELASPSVRRALVADIICVILFATIGRASHGEALSPGGLLRTGTPFVLGLAVAGLFVVPLANLFAPILGAAMATHLFHGGRGGHA